MKTRFFAVLFALAGLCASLRADTSGSSTATAGSTSFTAAWTASSDGSGGMHVSWNLNYSTPTGDDAVTFWFGEAEYDGDHPTFNRLHQRSTTVVGATFDSEIDGETTHTYHWIMLKDGTVGSGTITVEGPAAEYRAKLHLSNLRTTDVEISVHQLDAEDVDQVVTTFTVPAMSVVNYNFVGDLPNRLTVIREVVGASKVGASFVASGDNSTANLGFIDPTLYEEGGNIPEKTLYVGGPNDPLEDYKKSIWLTDSSTLNGDLFREGVDKIVGSVDAVTQAGGTGGGGSGHVTVDNLSDTNEKLDTANGKLSYLADKEAEKQASGSGFTAAMDAITATATSAGETLAGPLTEAMPGEASTDGLPGTPAEDLELFSWVIHQNGNDVTLAGKMPHASEFNWRYWGNIMREILLWTMAYMFLKDCRDKMMMHIQTFLSLSQITTKAETSQIAVPGVGWTKQVAVAAGWITAGLTAIAGTITLVNSNLSAVISGWSLGGLGGLLSAKTSEWVAAIVADPHSQAVVEIIATCFPLQASIQLMAAGITFSFALPALWMAAYAYAKVVHV